MAAGTIANMTLRSIKVERLPVDTLVMFLQVADAIRTAANTASLVQSASGTSEGTEDAQSALQGNIDAVNAAILKIAVIELFYGVVGLGLHVFWYIFERITLPRNLVVQEVQDASQEQFGQVSVSRAQANFEADARLHLTHDPNAINHYIVAHLPNSNAAQTLAAVAAGAAQLNTAAQRTIYNTIEASFYEVLEKRYKHFMTALSNRLFPLPNGTNIDARLLADIAENLPSFMVEHLLSHIANNRVALNAMAGVAVRDAHHDFLNNDQTHVGVLLGVVCNELLDHVCDPAGPAQFNAVRVALTGDPALKMHVRSAITLELMDFLVKLQEGLIPSSNGAIPGDYPGHAQLNTFKSAMRKAVIKRNLPKIAKDLSRLIKPWSGHGRRQFILKGQKLFSCCNNDPNTSYPRAKYIAMSFFSGKMLLRFLSFMSSILAAAFLIEAWKAARAKDPDISAADTAEFITGSAFLLISLTITRLGLKFEPTITIYDQVPEAPQP